MSFSIMMNRGEAILLDKFLNITQSDRFSLEIINNCIMISSISDDLSHFTMVKINNEFFSKILNTTETNDNTQVELEGEINCKESLDKVTLPKIIFFKSNMKTCQFSLDDSNCKLFYTYKHKIETNISYDKLKYTSLDIEYLSNKTINIDIDFFREILYRYTMQYVEIFIHNNKLTWNINNTTISINIESDVELFLKVSWNHMKRIFFFFTL